MPKLVPNGKPGEYEYSRTSLERFIYGVGITVISSLLTASTVGVIGIYGEMRALRVLVEENEARSKAVSLRLDGHIQWTDEVHRTFVTRADFDAHDHHGSADTQGTVAPAPRWRPR